MQDKMIAGNNEDRQLYQEFDETGCHRSLHVTKSGAIGINVGGSVWVMPLVAWHKLAQAKGDGEREAGKCPDCNGLGWYSGRNNQGEQEQIQCQRCNCTGTTPPSPTQELPASKMCQFYGEQDGGLREALADLEHKRWSSWQAWCHKVLREHCPSEVMEKILVRWDKQIATEYKDLSEQEKNSDRKEADKTLEVVARHTHPVSQDGLREAIVNLADYWLAFERATKDDKAWAKTLKNILSSHPVPVSSEEKSVPAPLAGCNQCGSRKVMIRSKFPGGLDREICPCCLVEKLENMVTNIAPHVAQQSLDESKGGK